MVFGTAAKKPEPGCSWDVECLGPGDWCLCASAVTGVLDPSLTVPWRILKYCQEGDQILLSHHHGLTTQPSFTLDKFLLCPRLPQANQVDLSPLTVAV